MRASLLVAGLAALAAFSGCGKSTPGASGAPDEALEANFTALRRNDVTAFLASATTPEQRQELARNWDEQRRVEPGADERQMFDSTMALLTAPDAEARVMAALEPKLEEIDAQMTMAAETLPMLAAGFMGATPATQQALESVGNWLGELDVTDEKRLASAVAIVTSTAKSLEIESMSELQALSYDQLVEKAGLLLRGIKGILLVYGLDVDATLESVDARVVSQRNGAAELEVLYSLFGAPPHTTRVQMIQHEGRWIPRP